MTSVYESLVEDYRDPYYLSPPSGEPEPNSSASLALEHMSERSLPIVTYVSHITDLSPGLKIPVRRSSDLVALKCLRRADGNVEERSPDQEPLATLELLLNDTCIMKRVIHHLPYSRFPVTPLPLALLRYTPISLSISFDTSYPLVLEVYRTFLQTEDIKALCPHEIVIRGYDAVLQILDGTAAKHPRVQD